MGYRKEDIPGMIEALTSARDRVISDQGVCRVLYSLMAEREISPRTYSVTGSMIEQALGKYNWLDSWIEANSGRIFNTETMRELRRQWIDKMIADLKEYAK